MKKSKKIIKLQPIHLITGLLSEKIKMDFALNRPKLDTSL